MRACTARGGRQGALARAAFSPKGHTLAVAGQDRRVRLLDLTVPDRPEPLTTPFTAVGIARQVNGLAFSPDGRTPAAGGSDNKAHLWNVTDPARPNHRAGGPVPSGWTRSCSALWHTYIPQLPYDSPCAPHG
ncbi:hypothetical protein OH768_22980 [Streptomyces sp. NBC_01622]|uniref:WD40 repeat domain-containing protein n=1 Tax=Streptomyces sp. NBC_01622 TaxID=2975903 RepID=UPI00386ABA53|nr:hypothetical protein OH768_22980 [Streptomyces sp. NBC_01622]